WAPCGLVMTRSRFLRPASSIDRSSEAKPSLAVPNMGASRSCAWARRIQPAGPPAPSGGMRHLRGRCTMPGPSPQRPDPPHAMPSPDPTPPRSVLSPWQRPLVKALVLGGIFLAATGLFLAGTPGGSPSASGAFVLHVIVGALL